MVVKTRPRLRHSFDQLLRRKATSPSSPLDPEQKSILAACAAGSNNKRMGMMRMKNMNYIELQMMTLITYQHIVEIAS